MTKNDPQIKHIYKLHYFSWAMKEQALNLTLMTAHKFTLLL